ncbi:MAG: hypothetical protein WC734_04620 [Patescibacteria group bacterium]
MVAFRVPLTVRSPGCSGTSLAYPLRFRRPAVQVVMLTSLVVSRRHRRRCRAASVPGTLPYELGTSEWASRRTLQPHARQKWRLPA